MTSERTKPRRRFGTVSSGPSHRYYCATGRRIAQRRILGGLTQAEMARRLDCLRHTVSQWERGTVAIPLYAVARIAEELECEIGELLP